MAYYSELAMKVLRDIERRGPLSAAAIDGDLEQKHGTAAAVLRELWAHGMVVQDGDVSMSKWKLTTVGQDHLDHFAVADE